LDGEWGAKGACHKVIPVCNGTAAQLVAKTVSGPALQHHIPGTYLVTALKMEKLLGFSGCVAAYNNSVFLSLALSLSLSLSLSLDLDSFVNLK
jgi:hypothetical protein